MKRRLRKKKHLREFREWGVPIVVRRKKGNNIASFLSGFLEQAIDKNCCLFCGYGFNNDLDGVIDLGINENEIKTKLDGVKSWLDNHDDIEQYKIGSRFDVWLESPEELDCTENGL
jgi:uncharacterized protein